MFDYVVALNKTHALSTAEANAEGNEEVAMTDAGILKEDYMRVAIIPKVGADGTKGANSHNSIVTHIATAEILADTLSQAWGFQRLHENITLEAYQHLLQNF